MVSPYIQRQIKNNSNTFEYTDYRNTVADLRKLNRDIQYIKNHDYIVQFTKAPPIIGLKATKITESKKNSLENLTMILEQKKFIK